jgi:hypothetical protein
MTFCPDIIRVKIWYDADLEEASDAIDKGNIDSRTADKIVKSVSML